TERVRDLTAACTEAGHPIDLTHALEPAYHEAAREVSARLALADPIPPLCTLVVASPFDAALHDAYGKAFGLNCYHTYRPDFLAPAPAHSLGPASKGERIDRYIAREPRASLPLYHLVGALDPLEPADVKQPVDDGLPEALGEWIDHDGLTHLKIKL